MFTVQVHSIRNQIRVMSFAMEEPDFQKWYGRRECAHILWRAPLLIRADVMGKSVSGFKCSSMDRLWTCIQKNNLRSECSHDKSKDLKVIFVPQM